MGEKDGGFGVGGAGEEKVWHVAEGGPGGGGVQARRPFWSDNAAAKNIGGTNFRDAGAALHLPAGIFSP
jgi:hypothetical protein